MTALERGLIVLEALAGSERPLGLQEVAVRARIPKTTAFRLLATLQSRGFVERTAEGSYHPGLRLIQFARTTGSIEDLRRAAQPFLQRLHRLSEETVNLAKWHEGQVVYVDTLPSSRPLRFVEAPGTMAPLHATALGKAVMAQLPQSEVEALLRRAGMPKFTPTTITSLPRFFQELRRVRARGFATDNQEKDHGAACIAAPVFDSQGVVAAISVSAPAPHMGPRRAAQLVPDLVEACAALSRQLGRRRPARVRRRT